MDEDRDNLSPLSTGTSEKKSKGRVSHDTISRTTNTNSGMAREHQVIVDGGSGGEEDEMVNLDKIVERFVENTKLCIKPSTQNEYMTYLYAMDRETKISNYSKTQLRGKIGKKIIMDYLANRPKPSWKKIISVIKSLWTMGLEIDWPITKKDIGKTPRVRRGESPPDNVIKQWASEMRKEPDVYSRLIWSLLANHGWRPSHIGNLKWRNVRFNPEGYPVVIVADGVDEGFKTHSPVVAYLCPEVAELINVWKEQCKNVRPEDLLIPLRHYKRQTSKPLNYVLIGNLFKRLSKRWNLPIIRPKDLRHWVSGICRKSGLSKQASAYLMGHDSASGGSMRDWYDNPQIQEVIAEQTEVLPDGALSYLNPPKVEIIIGGIPEEALNLFKIYWAGEISTLDFMSKIDKLRFSHNTLKP